MERGQREMRGQMPEYEIYNPDGTEKKVEVVNGNAISNGHGAASRMYVVRSKSPLPDPYRGLDLSKSPAQPKTPVSNNSNNRSNLFSGRELKRKKRVAKYKWYAIEGRVKASFNKGYTWFKRRCSRLVHGF